MKHCCPTSHEWWVLLPCLEHCQSECKTHHLQHCYHHQESKDSHCSQLSSLKPSSLIYPVLIPVPTWREFDEEEEIQEESLGHQIPSLWSGELYNPTQITKKKKNHQNRAQESALKPIQRAVIATFLKRKKNPEKMMQKKIKIIVPCQE
jgi:hypothetical protein